MTTSNKLFKAKLLAKKALNDYMLQYMQVTEQESGLAAIQEEIILPSPKKKRRVYNKELPIKYKSYLYRAEDKGLPFDLSIPEFEALLLLDCVYCGEPIANGVDRIDSSLGYTHINSVPCCTKCNMMKHRYSCEDFLTHVVKIYNHIK